MQYEGNKMAVVVRFSRTGFRCPLFVQTSRLFSATSQYLPRNSRFLSYATRNLSPEHQKRKIMVVGLREGTVETDAETLELYFKLYGKIEHAKVVRDQLSGKSKGYGFVTFDSPKVAEKVLSSTNHRIDGKDVKVLLAVRSLKKSRELPITKDIQSEELQERKIYVSALKTGDYRTTEQDLKDYFSTFGEVEDAMIVFPKSYGFVTFKYPETVKDVLSNPLHVIKGWKIYVARPFKIKDKTEIARKRKRTINVFDVFPEISDNDLIKHFSIFGEVEQVLGRDSDSNQSSQCMVVFKREDAAKMALKQQLQVIASRFKIYVKPLSDSRESNKVLLRGAPADITLEALQLYFEQFGDIVRMDLTSDHHRPTHADIHGVKYRINTDWPTVEFTDVGAVEKVLLHDHVICGRNVDVRRVDERALSTGAFKRETERSMMILIDDLDRNSSKEAIIDYFTSQSLMVQSVVFRMESNDSMSCVVGFWNLDDVDEVVNQASKQDGILFISGKPAYVRRLHWESTQENMENNRQGDLLNNY